ncbi:MAG: hypothetical protein R2911_00280 [Caldilineaceae bacterium]
MNSGIWLCGGGYCGFAAAHVARTSRAMGTVRAISARISLITRWLGAG